MTRPSERLKELGLTLPEPAKPNYPYVPAKRYRDLVWVSGQFPRVSGEVQVTGRVGGEVTVEQGYQSARIAALQGLAVATAAVGGDIDELIGAIRVSGYVVSVDSYFDLGKVVDGASDLLIDVFGKAGEHVRCAQGAYVLPRNSPVQIEFLFQARTAV